MDHGINYASEDVPKRVRELTDGRGVDLVVDPVGGRTLEGSIAALAYRGRISWVGRAGRESRTAGGVAADGEERVAHRCLPRRRDGSRPAARPGDDRRGCSQRVADGELKVVIDQVFPLAEAADAHRYIESRQAFGRVLLAP